MNRDAVRAFVVAGALAAFVAADARAERTAWNQESATALAERLADAAGALHEQIRKQPESPPASRVLPGDADLFVRDARQLEQRAEALAAMLAEGQGREETRGGFQSIETALHDVAEEGRSERVTEPVREAWAAVDRLHLELAPFYGDHDVHPQQEDLTPR